MNKLYRDEHGNQWDGNQNNVPAWVKNVIDNGGDIEDYNVFRFEDENEEVDMDEPDVMKCIVTHKDNVMAAFLMAKLTPTEELINILHVFDENNSLYPKIRHAYLGEGARTWPPTLTLAIGPSSVNTFEFMYLLDFFDCSIGVKDGVTCQEGKLYLQGEVLLVGADLAEDDDPEEAEYEVLATHDDGICSLSIDDINCNIITASLKYWEESIGLKIDDDNEEIRLKQALPKLANGWKKYNIGQGLVIHTNADPGVFDDLKRWLPFYGIDF